MATVLVTGATGTIGSQVTELLLEQGKHNVRVGVRSPDKAAPLKAAGAEVVPLDFDDPTTLGAAFAGVDRVFLLTGFIEHFVPHVERAVQAAKAADVSFILRMSALGADASSQEGPSSEHGKAEQLVAASGIPWAAIRPTFFMDNFLTYQGPSVRAQSAMYGASGGGQVTYVSSRDVAEVAVALLDDVDAFSGKTLEVTGEEPWKDDDVAAAMSDIAGREIRFVDLDADVYLEALKEQQTPAWMAEHMVALEGVKKAGWAQAAQPTVRDVLGRAPEGYRAFLTRRKDALAA
jgi:uncharacterized protein YbjT (DUF2867 family)